MKPYNPNHPPFGPEQEEKNKKVLGKLKNRLSHLRLRISRGAASIYRAVKGQCRCSSRQDKGHHKS